ncbi:MAG: hypothetical protein IPK60_23805 [Sandaracinaceae bacterium]|nr:hypothetical protein [Sandaracinaceae bacterium]
MSAPVTVKTPSIPARVLIGIGGSLLIHCGVLLLILFGNTGPRLQVDFFLPSEVEFGLTEGVTVAAAPTAAAPVPTPATAPAGSTLGGDGPGHAGLDGGVEDAGRRRRRDGGISDGGRGDATMLANAGSDAGGPGTAPRGALTMYAPPGAQLSVRFDLQRIRASRMHSQVAAFMQAVPDWQLLLNGSDINPIEDLDRLMIASTNLQRENWVISGRYTGDTARVERIVAMMAEARGTTAEWTTENGIPVAPWPNLDDVERRIALVGPNQFTITRPDDLPRVLAVARARADELNHRIDAGPNAAPTAELISEADALLALGEGEAIAADVEGAHNFVRGVQANIIPASLHAGVSETPNDTVVVAATGEFATQEECRAAQVVWNEQRLFFARSTIAALIGLSGPMQHSTLACEAAEMHFHMELSQGQVERLLNLATSFMPRLPPARTEAPNPPPTTPPQEPAGASVTPSSGALPPPPAPVVP